MDLLFKKELHECVFVLHETANVMKMQLFHMVQIFSYHISNINVTCGGVIQEFLFHRNNTDKAIIWSILIPSYREVSGNVIMMSSKPYDVMYEPITF